MHAMDMVLASKELFLKLNQKAKFLKTTLCGIVNKKYNNEFFKNNL